LQSFQRNTYIFILFFCCCWLPSVFFSILRDFGVIFLARRDGVVRRGVDAFAARAGVRRGVEGPAVDTVSFTSGIAISSVSISKTTPKRNMK